MGIFNTPKFDYSMSFPNTSFYPLPTTFPTPSPSSFQPSRAVLGYMPPVLPQPIVQVTIPPHLEYDRMSLQLAAYYAGARTDSMIDTNAVLTAVGLFGVSIDKPTAASLLQQIAGPRKTITQDSFVRSVIAFVYKKYSIPLPPPRLPPPSVQISLPSYLPYNPKPSVVRSGPHATHPDPSVADTIASFYQTAAAGGRIDGNAVIKICHHYHVGCDMAVAAQLLAIVAAPEGLITQEKFVHHIGVYITRNLPLFDEKL
ncbi:uncharacterized protein MONOS_5053 [Monocercomonoides exilis]|uniref:uncharacterized protein n=1 Tax=Monocercomonoides exilis TaxID=2049356 RepID=UPI00355A7370|nr:hypothetical protein MONOS_5053 [Monocercomonoides exilis]|eukprot:MONOS_5053.1-p1 / transcript=MONOS_5053.1 / gene=MONOS_5053 / organism=Monocercomonoides_exilis_PA203 / gene_product=unspecified product / transcript_product=unspecified product / location=Mono_scaffold00143:23230-24000(+) / protein_length=257 / sequence_SO=supercontig / SO=protein_coding / is_pseudo=false